LSRSLEPSLQFLSNYPFPNPASVTHGYSRIDDHAKNLGRGWTAARRKKRLGIIINKQLVKTGAIFLLVTGLIGAVVAVWPSTITRIGSYSYLPHGFCYLWNRQLLTLHVVSDSLIFLSYLSISCSLGWLMYRERGRLPFGWIFLAFGAFIVACGFTHAMEVVVLWIPLYWLSGDMKLLTAIASVITAVALPLLFPQIRRILTESANSRQNELRLLGAAESSMDALYFGEAIRNEAGEIEDFTITYFNTNAVRLVTLTREQLIGGRMCELFPVNRRLGLFERYKQVVLSGKPVVVELPIEDETIKTSWLRIQAVKLGDGVAITASNITERKQKEEALRKSNRFLERIGSIAGVGGWEMDVATRTITWSPEAYRILGADHDFPYQAEEGISLFFAPEDRITIRAAIERALDTGEGWDMELTLTRLDGGRIPVRVVGSVEFAEGKPVRLSGAIKDITERVAERLELKNVNERLSLAADSGGIGIWDWNILDDKLFGDSWMYRLYGLEEQHDVESCEIWQRHLHPEDREAAEAAIRDAINGVKPFNTEFRIIWRDGTVRYLRGTASVTRDEAGRAVRMVGSNWDISTVKESELKLAVLADFLHSIVASSPFATIAMDLKGVITSVNPAAERMLWYRKEDLIDRKTPLVLLNPDELARRAAALSEELQMTIKPGLEVLTANPMRGRVEVAEWKLVRRDGSCVDAQLTVTALTDAEDGMAGFILIAYDITERKRAQEYLAHTASHDGLTRLPMRNLFRDRLDIVLARAKRYGRKFSVLMIDVDNFKKVNDQMGHHVGDELLIAVAERLKSCVRASDTVARMGGDEFTVLLDELHGAPDAEMVAEKIVQELQKPVVIESHAFAVTASIGISVYPDDGETPQTLMRNADIAMYQAKAGGRNGRQLFTRELEAATSRKRLVEDCLNEALSLEEFELVYQPQICMKTGKVSGVEALLRWHSQKLGTVMPSEFIPVAEESGLIVPIGEWVLRNACQAGRQLQLLLERELTIAVNISPRQFQQSDLPKVIGQILTESSLAPSSLELEITENILLGNLPRPKAILEEIRSLGVHVAIDDFGTGYSSMSYVLRFRVDRLKIDQSFVREMASDEGSYAVTNAIIALAKGIHIPVVAEGVESADQRDMLLSEGCDDAQGYFYSKPVSMSSLIRVIHDLEEAESSAAVA
jgi:diguanylate cyclase (GGDEF)-like protein/PAS domain S-box-containing protein